MKLLGTYLNGNTIVAIYDDGTKERYLRDGETPAPEFPESMDLKITNRCDLRCNFCAEGSCLSGQHADLTGAKLLDSIKPYTELAIGGGNPLEHPDLVWFLLKMHHQKVICNLTVNVKHFMQPDVQYKLAMFTQQGLIHGIGVSVPDRIPFGFLKLVGEYPNAVIHTIAGITPMSVYKELADNDLNLLILGYKVKGRGGEFAQKYLNDISDKIEELDDNLLNMRSHFKAIAFDNLAVQQLNVANKLSKDEYNKLYMGADGEFTMYIDLVTKKYGKSSTHKMHDIDADTVPELFQKLKENQDG